MCPADPTPLRLSAAVVTELRGSLAEGLRKIEHCTNQLQDDQIWHRPRPEMNSIANLVLHLSGNLRQWIVSGVSGGNDIRNRPMEFSDQSNRPKAEIVGILQQTVSEADSVMAAITPETILKSRRIQGYETTILAAMINSISHFRGHVQEIIHMTRAQLGPKYRFDFVPRGKEQESAAGPAL